MRGFQKSITLGGSTLRRVHNVGLQNRVAKKNCKFFAPELGSILGVMRGFQKGITLWGRSPRSDNRFGLQIGVAKNFAKILHPNLDPKWLSLEVSKKV